MKKHVIIVGGGAAGMVAAISARAGRNGDSSGEKSQGGKETAGYWKWTL